MDKEKTKPGELQHPTVLRLAPELRSELMRLATRNGRSLSKEIAMRLQASLSMSPADVVLREPSGAATYVELKPPAGGVDGEEAAIETLLMRIVSQLPAEKKKALFELLR